MNNVEKNGYKKMPIIDAHLHLLRPEEMDIIVQSIANTMEYYQYERVNLCSLVQDLEKYDPFNNDKCFYVKSKLNTAEQPNRVYVFANLWHWYDERDTAEGYLKQVKDLVAMGADGIKFLDGKPEYRKKLARPLDDPIFDLMYAYLEKEGIPVVSHVGDPAKNWDLSQIDEATLQRGWFYDDTFPTLQQLRDETEGILKKFPKLKLCMAHFYFWGDELEQTKAMMDRYENVMFDLTPGGEMFVGFSKRPEEWRQFFIEYADRIIYGTDTYNTWLENLEDYEDRLIGGIRIKQCRTMLEKSEPFVDSFFGPLQPMHLDEATLEKIYYKNFFQLTGDPKPLDHAMLAEDTAANLEAVLKNVKTVHPEKNLGLYLANAHKMLDYFHKK